MSMPDASRPDTRPPSRIADLFDRFARTGHKAFIPYVTAGDPDLETSAAILDGLARGGADIIELGVPFSDPMADGEVIQAAMLRALGAGTNFAKVLDLLREFRKTHSTPVVLFGYLNPLYRAGLDQAAALAREAGADGFLVVDLPPEEAPQLTDPLRREGLDFIALFTPTSDDARVRAIAEQASGFAYYVSMTGITGDRLSDFGAIAERVARVKALSGLPVAVGFGIQSERDAVAVAGFADGVVVGSNLVKALAGVPRSEAAERARTFAASYRAALDAR
jgi:tryptophan synthase alpha chain